MRPALILALLAAPAAAQNTAPVPLFVEEAAIGHTFGGDWEFMVGGGVAVTDCNGDARPDLVIAGGDAGPAALFVNESATGGALTFARQESGAELDRVSGIWPLDVDGDGLRDLAVLRVGANMILRGLGGCRFEPAPADWGFDGGDAWSTAFAATWEPGQDWPTLAVGNYIDRTQDAFPWGSCTDNWLHRPDGAGWGPPLPLTPSFCALSILFTDWNRSGTPALRMSNDREYYEGGQEQLWHMADPPRLYTPDEGWARLRIWGMGIASHDINDDGFPDYFLTSMADSKLQVLAEGADRPAYADRAFPLGAIAQRPYTGGDVRPSTGWHAQFGDANNDGRFDLFIAKGNVSEMPDFAFDDPNNLMLRQADGTFAEVGDLAGIASMLPARGGALTDLNGDGWLDVIAVNRNAPTQIWRNTGTGAPGHWIALEPLLDGANRDAIGGWIEVRTAAGTVRQEITIGGGHGGGVLVPWHVGLGDATMAEVRLVLPDGSATAWQAAAADRVHHIGAAGLAADQPPAPGSP